MTVCSREVLANGRMFLEQFLEQGDKRCVCLGYNLRLTNCAKYGRHIPISYREFDREKRLIEMMNLGR